MSLTQNQRELALHCVLGTDTLLVRGMEGDEGLSQLSEYRIEALSERADLQIDDLLGTPMTLSVELPRGGQRFFHGYAARFALTGRFGRYWRYDIVLRPWLWFLTRASDCRIYQDQSVPQIIKSVFERYASADVDTSALSGSYQPLAYCVQYRETDFNFVSRLMEDEGIYYYFKCASGRHTMVLADSYGAHHDVPGYASVPFGPTDDPTMRESESIWQWRVEGEVQPGACALQAFDFERPSSAALLVKSSLPRGYAESSHEMFDYPGKYTARGAGETQARTLIESYHAHYRQVRAETGARGLFPGGLFALTEHPRGDQNRQHLIVSAHYTLHAEEYQPAPPPGTPKPAPQPVMTCSFSAIDRQYAWRSAPLTRKPLVHGPQTAMVVGKAGEEIWTDKYGRIKVQFHWDRVGHEDETSSCWVRVAQGWAGKRWGSMFIPRIGQEVIVSFLEGDPDQPLVTGSVYNADTMPPYALPEHATRSTMRSNASKGGGTFNELRFEDKQGSEQLFIHAGKNQDNRVRHDSREWVGHQRHQVVKGDRLERTGGDVHASIGGGRSEKVGGTVSLDAGMAMQAKAATAYGVEAGMAVTIKAGMSVIIEAGATIALKAGAAYVIVGPAGVIMSAMPLVIPHAGDAIIVPPLMPVAPQAPDEADEGKP
ncbi:type VI secretion system Vgr family protein [Janthinobacterium agaricidamnosum]|uniref:Rhs element Vgr family protein n=1 Tax=Janthinobacterium agaricidamnosum NBRC 102515 = DSM 9628 TaxID=1349767 RepID=W0VE73_9BURK|nr:type VI secretion system tip protein VgrG [Janthinobacterium agaricidamnosum]CDG85975.1 rhs element Vgr family protein [Janthinobacterium agaricidamnosum NBRC 102515 = DSM 9628]